VSARVYLSQYMQDLIELGEITELLAFRLL